ncbi:DNA ligase D [Hydrocarboniphaga effusa]|uniref:DNA ligase D n=1 Tax=Hydrocarboniphaga effusa TaxID=243629 RepID=UPI00398C1DBC
MATAAPRRRTPAALKRYNEKRRFDVTSEPRGEAAARSRGDAFVVQQHDATRMHYDFRLELDGVLLSWAVPKGPSLSPDDKRLAVQTEDHPIAYRNFEGNIPHGEYGGGPVIVWDRGRWKPEGDARAALKKGHLTFSLDGEKLKGRYSLVRTRTGSGAGPKQGPKSQWLLFKRSDEYVRSGPAAEITQREPNSVISGRTVKQVGEALSGKRRTTAASVPTRTAKAKAPTKAAAKQAGKASKLPSLSSIEPQLATLVDRPPSTGRWVYEIKYDGYRMLARLDRGKVQLRSRNQLDWTRTFPGIAAALSKLDAASAILDGEVCYVTADGRSSFQDLQRVLPRGGGEIRGDQQMQLAFYVFDVLHHDGVDVRDEPLVDRKLRLKILLGKKPPWPLVYSDHIEGDGDTALTQACASGLEGLIAKRRDAAYHSGRSADWLKLKCHRRQEFVIVGYTASQARTGFRSLLLGVREAKALRYCGKVGTGFDQALLEDIGARLQKLVTDEPAVSDPPRMRGVIWVKPQLVCEVEYTEVTRDGVLRHPSFQGLREDKPARQVKREKAVPVAAIEKEEDMHATASEAGKPRRTKVEASPDRPRKQSSARSGDVVEIGGVRISHADRVMDEASGVTKRELAEYHELVGPLLLPYARKRPIALVRCPQGDAQQCFFQKHKLPGLGDEVQKARIAGNEVIYVESQRGILELVQFNAIEIHGWGATMDAPDKPDWIVIDLDPDTALEFSDVVEAALEVRDNLDRIGLVSFVKTTGGKGLHVVVPLEPHAGWDSVKGFAQAIASAMAEQQPDRYVANMSKAKRKGRIFIDYLRNGQGATAVLPYSPRARPGATIAMPVEWKDIRRIDPKEFTVRSAERWLKKRKRDPWAELLTTRQRLPDLD